MKQLRNIVMIGALVALAACNNATRLGGDGTGGAGTGNGVTPGSVSDPSSVAYFQQAVGDRVLFPVDQATLTQDAKNVLTGQAKWLLANADYTAVIEGHADEQGTREYNLALGARRANAAREFLISQGVPGARLRNVSFGKERPIEVCSEETCYAKNRRAVTVLAGGLTG